MGLTRRIIFPALRIVIWAIIAAALVAIALHQTRGLSEAAPDPVEPGSAFEQPILSPVRGTIENKISFTGSIRPETAAEVKAEREGTIVKQWVADGAQVEFGAPLVVLKHIISEDGDSPLWETTTVRASATGTVSLTAGDGQEVGAGDVVARISSGTFSAVAKVEPHQLYQLAEAPSTAAVTITHGPPTFECPGVKTAPAAPSEGEETGGVEISCEVPADVLVFADLAATIDVVTDRAEDALLLPTTAVEGVVGSGKAWRYADTGELEEVEVTLGLTDGTMVEIISGLTDTDEVLEFVPGDPEEGGFFPEDLYVPTEEDVALESQPLPAALVGGV